METENIAISMDSKLLQQLDLLVEERVFTNRSNAIQKALKEKMEKLSKSRLAGECAKLDPVFEQKLADEGMAKEFETWPEY